VTADPAERIHDLRRRIEAAENACDAGVFADIVAEDVVVIVPDFPVAVGKDASTEFVCGVTDWMRENLDRHITYTSDEVRFEGNLAIDRGTFAFRAAFKDGHDPSIVTGKYMWIYRHDAGDAWKLWRWMVTRDEDNEDS
jgi:ketosteroid isomerase-like protein